MKKKMLSNHLNHLKTKALTRETKVQKKIITKRKKKTKKIMLSHRNQLLLPEEKMNPKKRMKQQAKRDMIL